MTVSWARRLWAWAPALVLMAAIFWFSANSSPPRVGDSLTDFGVKKLAHFGEYALLALLFGRALSVERWWPRLAWYSQFGLPLLLVGLYALSDEFHQSFVPRREPAGRDVLIDLAGAAVALVLLALWRRARQRRLAVEVIESVREPSDARR